MSQLHYLLHFKLHFICLDCILLYLLLQIIIKRIRLHKVKQLLSLFDSSYWSYWGRILKFPNNFFGGSHMVDSFLGSLNLNQLQYLMKLSIY